MNTENVASDREALLLGRRKKIRRAAYVGVVHFALILAAILFVFPLLWMLSVSLQSEEEMLVANGFWDMLVPNDWLWSNYREVFRAIPFLRYFKNSAIVTSLTVIGTVISASLASLYRDEEYLGEKIVRAVAAEEPFLTDFATAAGRGAYAMGADLYKDTPREIRERGEFFVDTLHHVHRISCPVLLTSGGKDETCPPETVRHLFAELKGTKSYTHFDYLPHGYSREFLALVQAWFAVFA